MKRIRLVEEQIAESYSNKKMRCQPIYNRSD